MPPRKKIQVSWRRCKCCLVPMRVYAENPDQDLCNLCTREFKNEALTTEGEAAARYHDAAVGLMLGSQHSTPAGSVRVYGSRLPKAEK